MSGSNPMYCDIGLVKDRMLIASNDTSYDTSLNSSVQEASRLVDIFMVAYTTVPLVADVGNPAVYAYEIQQITADFAASIFKRRMMPTEVKLRGMLEPDGINQIDATGWFAMGIRKLEQYIKSKYVVSGVPLSSNMYNPETYIDLFARGLITAKEARTYISGATQATVKHLQNDVKRLSESIGRTLNYCETLTKAESKELSESIGRTLNQCETIGRALNETINRIINETREENITRIIEESSNKTATLNDTVSEYHTRRQKSIAIISGKEDSDEYELQEE